MKKTKKKRQYKRSQFILSEMEIKKIYDTAKSMRNKLIILLLWECGLRSQEVAGIRKHDIDEKNYRIKIVGKYNKERLIPISRDTCFKLKYFIENELSNIQVYLFPSVRKINFPISRIQVSNICKNLGILAQVKNPHPDLKHINPHIFRHSFAHRLKNNGFTPREMADLMGHDSIITTQDIYSASTWKEISEKMESLVKVVL